MAELLRNRNLAKMRKPYALQLCRSWGYKCDVWVLRSSRKSEKTDVKEARRVKRPRPLQLATRSQLRPQLPPMSVSLDSLRHLIDTCLRPAALRAARCMAGLRVEASCRNGRALAAAREHNIENRRQDIQEVLFVMRALSANAAAQRRQAQVMLCQATALDGEEDVPAYQRVQLFEGPTRMSLQSLYRLVRAAEADMHQKAAEEVWPEWRAEFQEALVDCYAFFIYRARQRGGGPLLGGWLTHLFPSLERCDGRD